MSPTPIEGARKFLVVLGGASFVVCGWFLFVPTGEVGLFLFSWLVYRHVFHHTLFEIPHLAMGNDLAVQFTGEKQHLWLPSSSGRILVCCCFLLCRYCPYSIPVQLPQRLYSGPLVAVACVIIPLLYIFVVKVPSTKPISRLLRNRINETKATAQTYNNVHCRNRPLLWFLAAFSSAGIGIGMWFSLVFLLAESLFGSGGIFCLDICAWVRDQYIVH